jgi:hypothetical protein
MDFNINKAYEPRPKPLICKVGTPQKLKYLKHKSFEII